MNHLAHFHLAGEDHGQLLGALLGDHVKGPLRGEHPDHIERGIRLHRRIDAITDSHPEVRGLITQLPTDLRRYGGIALDVCFDRCLNRNWPNWHDESLPRFCAMVFDVFDNHRNQLPEAAVAQYRRLQRYDTLLHLQHWETVDRILAAIGSRLRRANPLHRATAVLRSMASDIDSAFQRFYPDLQQQLQREFA